VYLSFFPLGYTVRQTAESGPGGLPALMLLPRGGYGYAMRQGAMAKSW